MRSKGTNQRTGFGVNEVLAHYNSLNQTLNPNSFHDEVAYSIAHEASLAGTRAATLTKSHGLIKRTEKFFIY